MVRQKGGLKWKQGADGCIFKPSVLCKGATHENPPNTISKVVPKGSIDEYVESVISSRFRNVVDGKGVLIASQRCTPEFSFVNDWESKTIQAAKKNTPCKTIDTKHPDLYTNFVIERYDTDFFSAVNPPAIGTAPPVQLDLLSTLKLLRRSLNAAVALVPDDGPWVIGLDFHIGNILVKLDAEPFSSLADWGRTLIIQDPNDLNSIRAGLLNAAEMFIDANLMPKVPDPIPAPYKKLDYIRFTYYAGGPTHNYDQFGIEGRRAMDILLHRQQPHWRLVDFQLEIPLVRVNSIYGILRSAKKYSSLSQLPNIDLLLVELQIATSQQDIIDTLNTYIQVPGIANYIDLPTFFPPATPGGFRKKKKTLKRRARTTRRGRR
jgi:hypothetical protein